MKVEKCQFIKSNNIHKKPNIAFKHSADIQKLKNINIGEVYDGLIGKIRVRDNSNSITFLNIIKKSLVQGYENYLVQNDNNDTIGEIILTTRKYINYDRLQYPSDPSHVFVADLKNYSNPQTPYYKNLKPYKDIGIRLMQIALQRSYEAMCYGNLKLISKNEAKEWYKNVIGMTEEFPETEECRFSFNVHNQNSLILPDEAKTHLSTLHGGL